MLILARAFDFSCYTQRCSIMVHRDSYPMQSSNGYQPRTQNPFAQQDDNSFESTAKASTANLATPADSMTAFYGEVMCL